MQALQGTSTTNSAHSLWQGLLYSKGNLMVQDDHNLKQCLLQDFHNTLLGRHTSPLRIFMRIDNQFYWKGMCHDVHTFVQECMVCQQSKHLNTPPSGLLQSLPIPQQIWEDIAMDFICGYPSLKGYSVIFVVIDRVLKHGDFMPLKSNFSSVVIAKVFIHYVLKLHGILHFIVCGRDKGFTSHF